MTDEKQWLVRKRRGGLESSIKVLGPFWSAQIREMVLNSALELEDEVCVENGYWIGLHEREEIKSMLGVDPVARTPKTTDQENTQPDIEATDEITMAGNSPTHVPTIRADDIQIRERGFQRLTAPVVPKMKVVNPQFLGVEKSRYWGILLVLFTLTAIVGILWLIRVLDI
ncbi:MAG TPA: hypothetical protein PLH57_01425 [Oligoflexia bacterium]|nr:hypothetical protein [Oligoflexia bacterium]